MEYKHAGKYRFLNADMKEVGYCYAVDMNEAERKLAKLQKREDKSHLIGCTAQEPYTLTQSEKNRRSLIKREKETGIVNKTVRMHKKAEKAIKRFAKLDLQSRGLE